MELVPDSFNWGTWEGLGKSGGAGGAGGANTSSSSLPPPNSGGSAMVIKPVDYHFFLFNDIMLRVCWEKEMQYSCFLVSFSFRVSKVRESGEINPYTRFRLQIISQTRKESLTGKFKEMKSIDGIRGLSTHQIKGISFAKILNMGSFWFVISIRYVFLFNFDVVLLFLIISYWLSIHFRIGWQDCARAICFYFWISCLRYSH